MLLGPHSGSRPKTPQCDILSVGTHLPWMLGSDSPNGWDQLPTFYEPRTAEIGDVSETNSGGSSSKKWCLKLQHTKNGGFCKNGFSHTRSNNWMPGALGAWDPCRSNVRGVAISEISDNGGF